MALRDEEFFAFVDGRHEAYVKRLAEFVAIPGVSAEPARRPALREAVLWAKAEMEKLGGEIGLEELGSQTLTDGTAVPLPPVLVGTFGADPAKRTVLVYGHLDVQPAAKEDGWDTEPFVLTEKNGALYGRGATDDKGPVLAWFAVIEAYQALKKELPVNLRFLLEGMEESGSVGLPELCHRLGVAGGHLDPAVVDYVCITDTYWIGKTQPCLQHGLRGNVYFYLEVVCSSRDMHSGTIGGSVHEAMTDLTHLMAGLVAPSGKILVEGIMDEVAPMTDAERERISQVEFDLEEYKKDCGISVLGDKARFLHATKEDILAHRWRYPTLSLHGIEGAFSSPGAKTVIPAKVVGKFSIRTVPHMKPENVEAAVRRHVEAHFAKLGSACQMTLKVPKSGMWWFREPNDPNFAAASAATVRVHGLKPSMTRTGGSIPITEVLEAVCEASCVHIPLGASDDGAHSQNEKFDRKSYFSGIKLLGCYLDEIAKLPPDIPVPPEVAAENHERQSKRRRRCKIDLTRYGCDCLECQVV